MSLSEWPYSSIRATQVRAINIFWIHHYWNSAKIFTDLGIGGAWWSTTWALSCRIQGHRRFTSGESGVIQAETIIWHRLCHIHQHLIHWALAIATFFQSFVLFCISHSASSMNYLQDRALAPLSSHGDCASINYPNHHKVAATASHPQSRDGLLVKNHQFW